jgi:hemolysin III
MTSTTGTANELREPGDRESIKPEMRGVLHHWAALVAFGATAVVIALAPSARAMSAAAAHGLSLVTLLTVSATYHRLDWLPHSRLWMKRADHSAIFLLIAGTYTPVALLALPTAIGFKMLALVWAGAIAGITQSLLWVKAPRLLVVLLYLSLGWAIIPFASDVHRALSGVKLLLLYGGGIAYSLGAAAYGFKHPNPKPGVFGYHEVFHAMTLVASAMHFALLVLLVRGR